MKDIVLQKDDLKILLEIVLPTKNTRRTSMNISIKINFNKCTLLGLAVILLLGGCGLNNTKLENNSNKFNIASTRTDHKESEKQEIKELSFHPVRITQVEPRTLMPF